MMFDEYGMRIRPADIQKSEFIHTRSPMNSHSTGPCKGLCQKYKAKKPLFRGRYAAGQVRCQICEIYLRPDGTIRRSGTLYCKCCNYRVRSKPRNSFYKEQYHEQVTRNVNEPWIEPESTGAQDENYQPEKESESTTEVKKSGKTYFELKDFLEDEIKPQANYQFVMLKHLLNHQSAHRGEIAEALAFFNNKNTSEIEEVKPFLYVPVFYVLVKHGFVKEYYSNHEKWYELNVYFENEYQKYEIDSLLEKKINEWNTNHGILENQIVLNGINWDDHNNLLRESNNWIWSVSNENWRILKEKNIWGSKIPHYKTQQKVNAEDYIIFYVIGTKAFKGIYKVSGNWYDDSKNLTWDDEQQLGEPIYLSAVKIKPVVLGSTKIDDLLDLTIFEGKDQNLVNLVLKGGSGYPSNNQRSIPSNDYMTIKKMLEQHPEELEQEEKPDSELVVKECPKCHSKVEGLPGIELDNKIEDIFGYRQMDPNDPLNRKPQSYCRKCRKAERTSVEQGKTDLEHLTVFDSEVDRINIRHYDLQDSVLIEKGQNLTNDELVAKFGVGNMGGIRYSSKNNVIVLCDTESGHYTDEIDKEFQIIYYSGEGKLGDQSLTGGNQRIVESENTPMFYFIEVPQEPGQNKRGALGKIYRFVGKVRYLKHTTKTENDIDGNPRQVIKFLLEIEK